MTKTSAVRSRLSLGGAIVLAYGGIAWAEIPDAPPSEEALRDAPAGIVTLASNRMFDLQPPTRPEFAPSRYSAPMGISRAGLRYGALVPVRPEPSFDRKWALMEAPVEPPASEAAARISGWLYRMYERFWSFVSKAATSPSRGSISARRRF
ncbi:MAG: hypothetical protein HY078_03095 [Elusimicrobia bacterium]|nr:hypothetical protein [Elusimicrobiota bacterium]